jgi:hypothetical protein
MKHPEPEGLLSVAARTVGTAAGKTAKAFGLEEAEASKPAKAPKKSEAKPKSGKRVSMRSKRIAQAAAVKKAAVALKDSAAARDLRYGRIMGKTPSAWSQADVDYIDGLKSAKKRGAPA